MPMTPNISLNADALRRPLRGRASRRSTLTLGLRGDGDVHERVPGYALSLLPRGSHQHCDGRRKHLAYEIYPASPAQPIRTAAFTGRIALDSRHSGYCCGHLPDGSAISMPELWRSH